MVGSNEILEAGAGAGAIKKISLSSEKIFCSFLDLDKTPKGLVKIYKAETAIPACVKKKKFLQPRKTSSTWEKVLVAAKKFLKLRTKILRAQRSQNKYP